MYARMVIGEANSEEQVQEFARIYTDEVLPELEKSHARALRKGELEIAFLGKSDEDFADKGCSLALVQKLTGARLPIGGGTDEIVDGATARKGSEHRNDAANDREIFQGYAVVHMPIRFLSEPSMQ